MADFDKQTSYFTVNNLPFKGNGVRMETRVIVYVDDHKVEELSASENVEVRILEGVLGSLVADGSVTALAVKGSITAGGSIKCDCVGGAVNAGGSVKCGRVGGSVSAGGSIRHA